MKGAGELKRLVLQSSRRQCIYRPSKPAYFTSLWEAASSATAPASRAAAEMYESANGQMTVTSQQSALPFCQGMRESPSGRFPSEQDKPVGSLTTETPAAEKLRAIKSFREWCLSCRVPSCKQSYGDLKHQPLLCGPPP